MIIVDPSIEPFYIKIEKSNYNVYQKHTPKSPAKPYEKFVCASTDLVGALGNIVDRKMEKKGGAVSLIEYLKEIRGLKLVLRAIVHDDLDARLLHLQKQINELKTQLTGLKKSGEFEIDL